ncbi:MAG: hypothetical protein R1F54_10040 [Candidatus Zeuxoniibacter abyssi]|nr:MAG: hypothetical protein R1F54_10040 [Candidatus Persebacteraceae bacterium AB1(2)]
MTKISVKAPLKFYLPRRHLPPGKMTITPSPPVAVAASWRAALNSAR